MRKNVVKSLPDMLVDCHDWEDIDATQSIDLTMCSLMQDAVNLTSEHAETMVSAQTLAVLQFSPVAVGIVERTRVSCRSLGGAGPQTPGSRGRPLE